MSDVESAGIVPNGMARNYRRWLQEDRNSTLIDLGPSTVSVHPGALAWTADLQLPDSGNTYPWAILAVQIDETVQILSGLAGGRPALHLPETISQSTLERWPNSRSSRPRRGAMMGGLWDALAHPDDLDADWEISLDVDITGEFGNPCTPPEVHPWPC